MHRVRFRWTGTGSFPPFCGGRIKPQEQSWRNVLFDRGAFWDINGKMHASAIQRAVNSMWREEFCRQICGKRNSGLSVVVPWMLKWTTWSNGPLYLQLCIFGTEKVCEKQAKTSTSPAMSPIQRWITPTSATSGNLAFDIRLKSFFKTVFTTRDSIFIQTNFNAKWNLM